MKTATATLKSISPYSQGRAHEAPKLEKEGADDYDLRTWRERMHAAADGRILIPPMAFKNCIAECAKFFSKPKHLDLLEAGAATAGKQLSLQETIDIQRRALEKMK